ncbi:hypothetical protein LWI28_011708 [Acer negundo]|uniref:Uncharacterized protein n=1 Tax=Acer negundo TaxID=4023 RepID=A0AAD5IEN5_ACENE|nr:hypothetical protein LWI28_011708 [Acer negundo]
MRPQSHVLRQPRHDNTIWIKIIGSPRCSNVVSHGTCCHKHSGRRLRSQAEMKYVKPLNLYMQWRKELTNRRLLGLYLDNEAIRGSTNLHDKLQTLISRYNVMGLVLNYPHLTNTDIPYGFIRCGVMMDGHEKEFSFDSQVSYYNARHMNHPAPYEAGFYQNKWGHGRWRLQSDAKLFGDLYHEDQDLKSLSAELEALEKSDYGLKTARFINNLSNSLNFGGINFTYWDKTITPKGYLHSGVFVSWCHCQGLGSLKTPGVV